MDNQAKRGSDKLMSAWKTRLLSEESVREIVAGLEKSPGKVESANVVGGANATGMTVAMSYEGDDVPFCGNDILFWLKWHLAHGGAVRPPRIIINGIPFPDFARVELDFGHVGQPSVANAAGQLGQVAGQLGAGSIGG